MPAVPVCDHICLYVFQSQIHAIFRVHRGHRCLRQYWEGTRFPAVDVGPIVDKYSVRRLSEMRAQTYLVSLRPGESPKGLFHAGQFFEFGFQCLYGWVAVGVVYIVIDRGVYDSLRLSSVDETFILRHRMSRLSYVCTCIIVSVGSDHVGTKISTSFLRGHSQLRRRRIIERVGECVNHPGLFVMKNAFVVRSPLGYFKNETTRLIHNQRGNCFGPADYL